MISCWDDPSCFPMTLLLLLSLRLLPPSTQNWFLKNWVISHLCLKPSNGSNTSPNITVSARHFLTPFSNDAWPLQPPSITWSHYSLYHTPISIILFILVCVSSVPSQPLPPEHKHRVVWLSCSRSITMPQHDAWKIIGFQETVVEWVKENLSRKPNT